MRCAVADGSHRRVECELHAAHDGGDHEILVGRVLRVVTNKTKTPLVCVRGGFLNAELELQRMAYDVIEAKPMTRRIGAEIFGVDLGQPEAGGDTCFASMYWAYETLSQKMNTCLEGLLALHGAYGLSD